MLRTLLLYQVKKKNIAYCFQLNVSNYHSGNCITRTGFFYFWNWLEKVKEKKNKKITKKRQRREEWGTLRRPFLTKPRERKTFLNLSVRGLSLSLSLCFYVSLFLLHAGPCPGGFGKCQAMDWQRMRGCGRELRGESEAGEEQCFLRFSDTIFVLHF